MINRVIHLGIAAVICLFQIQIRAEETTAPQTPAPPVVEEKATPLDTSIQSNAKDDAIPGVFKDMVVVQRRAKKKADRILFSTFGTIDFSDGPITSYGINFNPGYALSDSWEVYLNIAPFFITTERPIVKKVRDLTLANGTPADIVYAKPVLQYGGEILWLPAYGKESWGAHSIVRSDTFLKLGLAMLNFQGGTTGLRTSAMVGKTFFIANYFNFRLAAGLAFAQSVVEDEKKFNWFPALETGLVFYF